MVSPLSWIPPNIHSYLSYLQGKKDIDQQYYFSTIYLDQFAFLEIEKQERQLFEHSM